MKKIGFLCAILSFFFNASSQDALLLNKNFSLLDLNPSFAGSNGGIRDQFLYMTGKDVTTTDQTTYYNGLDAYVKALRGGVALSVLNEEFSGGVLRNSQVNFIYAPQFKCPKSGLKIIPSIQLTYLQRYADNTKLTWGNSIVNFLPAYLPPTSNKSNIDGSMGLLVQYKALYIGATAFHMNQPDVGLYGQSKLPARFSANASYNFLVGSNTQLNVYSAFFRQSKYYEVQAGIDALFIKHIIAGVSCNTNYLSGRLGYRADYFTLSAGYNYGLKRHGGRFIQYAYMYELGASFNLRNKADRHTLTNFESW